MQVRKVSSAGAKPTLNGSTPEFPGLAIRSPRPLLGGASPTYSRGVAEMAARANSERVEFLSHTETLIVKEHEKLSSLLEHRLNKLDDSIQKLLVLQQSSRSKGAVSTPSTPTGGQSKERRLSRGVVGSAILDSREDTKSNATKSGRHGEDAVDEELQEEEVVDLDSIGDVVPSGETERDLIDQTEPVPFQTNSSVFIKVRKEWAENPIRENKHRMNSSHSMWRSRDDTGTQAPGTEAMSPCKRVFHWLWYRTVVSPQNPFQMLWEFLSVLVVIFDMFELPLQAFNPPDFLIVTIMRWATQVFWQIDLFFGTRFGFYAHNEVVLNPNRIVKRYLQTWFIFDFFIVALGWIILILSASEDSYVQVAKAGKTLKVCRAAKTLKMMRLMKMKKAFHSLEDHIIHSLFGSQTPLWGCAKFLLAIILVTHFLCSFWFWVGDNMAPAGWVAQWDMNALPFWERYLFTFHWALSQFGVGNSPYAGSTSEETLCNVLILLIGLLITALLVSSITNTFSLMQQQTADQFHQLWLLRRFCLEREFPRWLSNRIAKHMEHQMRKKEAAIQLRDVKLLETLSGPLQAEVIFHTFLAPLSSHPLFRALCRDDPYTMREVSTMALTEHFLAENDLIFVRGAVAKNAVNVMSGDMSYQMGGEIVQDIDNTAEIVESPAWISEQVLWTEWVHCGDLYAKSVSQCLAIDAMAFCEQVRRQGDTFQVAQAYALARVEELRNMITAEYSDICELSAHGLSGFTSKSQVLEGIVGRSGIPWMLWSTER